MLMNDLNKSGHVLEIRKNCWPRFVDCFGTGWADEDQVRESIKHCWDEHHYSDRPAHRLRLLPA